MADTNDCRPCPLQCAEVVDRLFVSHLHKDVTRVAWDLLDTFTDPSPLIFQLQVAETANPEDAAWEDVGLPVIDQYFAIDDTQRDFGAYSRAHYRLKITAPSGVYFSLPTGAMGVLDKRDWRHAREIVRNQILYCREGFEGQRGFLLKRRWAGVDCDCLDPQTKEVIDPGCEKCFGTGKRCGYYYPMGCVWAAIGPKKRITRIDAAGGRGTVTDIKVSAEMTMIDLLDQDDVFVSEKLNDRYYIRGLTETSSIRGVPLVATVALHQVPFSSPIHNIEIPDELTNLWDTLP